MATLYRWITPWDGEKHEGFIEAYREDETEANKRDGIAGNRAPAISNALRMSVNWLDGRGVWMMQDTVRGGIKEAPPWDTASTAALDWDTDIAEQVATLGEIHNPDNLDARDTPSFAEGQTVKTIVNGVETYFSVAADGSLVKLDV